MASEQNGHETRHPLITKEDAVQFLPKGLNIPMDEYFPKGGALCGEKHLEYVLGLMYPILYLYRQIIVGQHAPTLVTLIGMFAVGDRSLDHTGPGHVYIIGPPGTGKTFLGMIPEKILKAVFKRISGNPELLPTDITGNEIWLPDEKRFKFFPGPIFSDVCLYDEMNRSSKRSQSAMLPPMGEGRVDIRGIKYETNPFLIATGNLDESAGVQEIPDALRDRFMFQVGEKPFTVEETTMIQRRSDTFANMSYPKIGSYADILQARLFFHKTVYVSDEIDLLISRLTEILNRIDRGSHLEELRSRLQLSGREPIIASKNTRILSGRGTTHLRGAARSIAALRYRNYVTLEDVQEVLRPVIRHRVYPTPQALSAHEDMFAVLEKELDRVGKSAMGEFILREIIKVAWNHASSERE